MVLPAETPDLVKALAARRRVLSDIQRTQATRWWDDPVAFVEDCITFPDDDGGLAEYQAEELAALVEHGRVAVRAPRGSGKTMPAAITFWWFAITRELAQVDWKIAATAGSWSQLTVYLFPEIRKWVKHIDWDKVGLMRPRIGVELLTHQLKWSYGEAFGRAATDPELIEGAHATNVLMIIDEGKSVDDGIWDAVEGFFSNPGEHFALALSTPGAAAGRFYEIHARRPGFEDWYPIHITIDRAVAAGRVAQKWVDQRRRQWGADSVAFRCHVLAEFGGTEDGVIPLAWVEAAMERWKALDMDEVRPERIGVDVADTGNDDTVFAFVWRDACYKIERFNDGDVVLHADRVHARAVTGTKVVVDSIGVGAGTLAAAKRLGLAAEGFVASERTNRTDETGTFGFINKRAAAWWMMREALQPVIHEDGTVTESVIVLPPDEELLGDLTAPTYKEASGGRLQMESKDQIRKRIGRSTDVGDAVIMAFWRDEVRTLPDGWADNVAV